MESSDSINEGENDMEVLLEKQESQFRAPTEALKDSLRSEGHFVSYIPVYLIIN